MRTVAESRAVPLARAALSQFAARQGAPEAVRAALALAVTEACSNVVLHAYVDAAAPGELEVRGAMVDRVLVVEVADQGRGMIPRLDSPGLGLGLPLIAQMADVVEVLDRQERPGVVLRMHFDLARAGENERTSSKS